MSPWVVVGSAVFVIFDAMVLILVLSLADWRRSSDDPQRMRDLSARFPWSWSAANFRVKIAAPQEVESDPDLTEQLVRLLRQLGAPMLAYMLRTDPGSVLRWSTGQEKPLGLAVHRRVQTIATAVKCLSPGMRDRQIRRWFNATNSLTNGLMPAEAVRRDYWESVITAAECAAQDR
jgi:hypothetical protein